MASATELSVSVSEKAFIESDASSNTSLSDYYVAEVGSHSSEENCLETGENQSNKMEVVSGFSIVADVISQRNRSKCEKNGKPKSDSSYFNRALKEATHCVNSLRKRSLDMCYIVQQLQQMYENNGYVN